MSDGHRSGPEEFPPEPGQSGPPTPRAEGAPAGPASAVPGPAPAGAAAPAGQTFAAPTGDPAASAEPVPAKETPVTDWQRLHPLSVWASTVVVGLFLVPSAIVVTVVLVVAGQPLWALLPVPAALAFTALMTYFDLLRLRATRYRVTDERMEMRSGIVAKSYRSIPRERVRSVDVAAPIYVRIFGLCSVTVGTGEQVGAGADQLQLLYVTAEQGEWLRRDLLRRGAPAGAVSGTGEAAEDGAGEDGETELARLDRRWFAYAPATTATLGVGLGAIAGLLGLNAQTGGVGWDWLSEQANLPSVEEMSSFVMGQILIVVPLTLLGLLVSGVVVLTAVAVETWWNYRLTREADGTVRLRRGLLTSVSLSVEGRRLNGVTLHEPYVLRLSGGADVRAVATGLAAADDQKTSARSRLSPAMPRERARGLAADLMGTPDSPLDVALAVHPRAALRRRFTRAAVVAVLGAVLSGALAWLHTLIAEAWWDVVHEVEREIIPVPLATSTVEVTPSWAWAVLAVAIAAAAFWYAVGSYRGLGHGLHPRYLVVRKGMAVRDTVTLERSAVIGWRINRSPFQRRLGLADVAATTAAGQGMYAARDVGLGQGLAWADEAVPELLAPFLVRDGQEDDGGRGTGGGASRP
ncbi:PH domain-containing protein [Nocardiopsis dassonvillei]|uniref:PH domain-containing protein n=1 Tax=Nocardiopsis dassonvillei TaxID=2014 RepID=UPI00200EEAE7|nr:PH domain-containing protein [Nocardiopsis dassonvillei]MCK9869061.1 PH domain-containing protein [Nocardiopsis dassonvillei]